MSDVSAVTHLLAKVNEGFITTTGSTISSGASAVPLTSLSGLTNGTTFVGIIEPGATNQQVFTGVVDTGGSQITGVHWTRGTNVGHSAGVTVVDYSTGTLVNMLTKWAAVQHNDDGTHSAITATSITTAALTVNGQDVTQLLSSGMMVMYGGSSAPTGWVMCDGSSLSRSTYAALFASIGTAYGTVDSSHFNVPDMRGKGAMGLDGTTEFAALGTTGGEKAHALTIGELAVHNHGVNDGGHNHRLWSIGQESNVYSLGGTSTRAVLIGGNPNAGNGNTGDSGANISIQNNGSGTAHNNLHPYNTVNFVIKA